MHYQLSVVVDQTLLFQTPLQPTIEIGRQQSGEPAPFEFVTSGNCPRLIVAPQSDTGVSRRQLQVELLAAGRMELTNLSATADVQVVGRPALGPGQKTTIEIPCAVVFGNKTSLMFSDQHDSAPLQALPEATLLPGQPILKAKLPLSGVIKESAKNSEPLIKALQAVIDIFLSAKNERELLTSAVEGALSLIGFDTARVLRNQNGGWQEVYSQSQSENFDNHFPPSQRVIDSVQEKRRTFWDSRMDGLPSASLTHINAVIGAPVLDSTGEVIAILYGDRLREMSYGNSREITSLDAQLMELLACGVAAGLARLSEQSRADQMRLQFVQFFTPELAAELELNPNLLTGQDADVSLLFCDIRGFSRISERVGTSETFYWIRDMMDTLSESVLDHGGVLVDYIGDELMAMWGAPRSQDDHAEQACQAGMAMLAKLPELNTRWSERLGEPIELSIGINSGFVKVGNTGSRQKFKYSPLGTTVNLASRVMGATRHLKTDLLVTGTTAEKLSPAFLRRKVSDIQVVNVDEPIEIFELSLNSEPQQLYQLYAAALVEFERGEFLSAAHQTARLLEQFPNDGPSLVLLSRAVQALVDGPADSHPVWKLTAK